MTDREMLILLANIVENLCYEAEFELSAKRIREALKEWTDPVNRNPTTTDHQGMRTAELFIDGMLYWTSSYSESLGVLHSEPEVGFAIQIGPTPSVAQAEGLVDGR
jgi:hypothetical protein